MADQKRHLVGYARVSTADQSLQLQLDALTSHGVALEDVHTDVASGAAKYRRGLEAAFKDLRRDDILVIWSLDRLGRNLEELIKAVQRIEGKGANLRVLTQAIDTTTPGGRLIFHVMGAMAEFERALILERTNAGLAAARAAGRVGGRRSTYSDATKAAAVESLRKGLDPKAVSELHGISLPVVYRWRKKHGI
jgi:DNA invertase Pin-like site-specific DNA recombinase